MTPPVRECRGPTGIAVFGQDGRLLVHTPGFTDALGLGETEITADATLDAILARVRALHPDIETLAQDRPRRRAADAGTIAIDIERLADGRCCVTATSPSARGTTEAAAEAAGLAASRFLTTMSHELRTPFNAVIGFSDALTREAAMGGDAPLDRARVAAFAEDIQRAGQRILSLVDEMIDVARIESGRLDLAAEIIDLSHLLDGCVRHAADAAGAAAITLALSVRPGLPHLRGDARRLRQVVAHLLANAIESNRGGGRIVITAERAADEDLLITVRDSGIGIGISEAASARVVEPCQPIDEGPSRRVAGAGLGLYFCRALARAHGGEFNLDSRPGVGTTATVRLPRTRLITAPPSLAFL